MKTINYNGIIYKEGDWVKLLKTPHGGYDIGDTYQIHEITGIEEFNALHKTANIIQNGFTISIS